MVPGETTHPTLSDFDDREMPQEVLAAGNGHLKSRFLSLDRFTSHTLGRHLNAAHRAGHHNDKPLTYNGRKHVSGSTQATASAQGVIDRLFKEIGLSNHDVTASSVYLWRVQTTFNTAGPDLAREPSGRTTTDQMFHSIGHYRQRTSNEPDDDEGLSFADAA